MSIYRIYWHEKTTVIFRITQLLIKGSGSHRKCGNHNYIEIYWLENFSWRLEVWVICVLSANVWNLFLIHFWFGVNNDHRTVLWHRSIARNSHLVPVETVYSTVWCTDSVLLSTPKKVFQAIQWIKKNPKFDVSKTRSRKATFFFPFLGFQNKK